MQARNVCVIVVYLSYIKTLIYMNDHARTAIGYEEIDASMYET